MRIHNLYADDRGESHFRDIEVEWGEATPAGRVSERTPASGIIFRQVPFVAQAFAPNRPIGCLTATRQSLGNRVLALAGIEGSINVVLKGMEEAPHFKEAILDEGGELDSDLIEAETVAAARELQAQYPDLGAIVLECSLMPPYAKAVQDATGLPVFDFVSMIDYFYRGTHRRDYDGYY